MAVVFLILSAVITIFFVLYLIIELFQRSNSRSETYFELYKNNEFLVFFTFFYAIGTFIGCIIIPFANSALWGLSMGLFISQLILFLITFWLFRPKAIITNDKIDYLKPFGHFKFEVNDINKAEISNYNIIIYIKHYKLKFSNYCTHFEQFRVYLAKKLNSQIYTTHKAIHKSETLKIRANSFHIFGLSLISIILLFASVMITIYNDNVEAGIWIYIFFYFLSITLTLIVSLYSFRWKVDINDSNLIYTPIFGKTCIYKIRSITNIIIFTSSVKASKTKEIMVYLDERKSPIIIAYRSRNAHIFLDMFKYKVEYDNES